jgi:hypothetical protein
LNDEKITKEQNEKISGATGLARVHEVHLKIKNPPAKAKVG